MINFRRMIYILKRKFPASIDLYVVSGEEFDILTGKKTAQRIKYTINRAIVLPLQSQYNNPVITALAKTTGTMIVGTRNIIIDAKDIPIVPQEGMYVDYNDTRYEVATVQQLDDNTTIFGYQLTVKEAQKELPFFINDFTISHKLSFAQTMPLTLSNDLYDQLVFTESYTNG